MLLNEVQAGLADTSYGYETHESQHFKTELVARGYLAFLVFLVCV